MALPYKDALQRLENRRVKATRPLIPPQILQEDLPLSVTIFTPLLPANAAPYLIQDIPLRKHCPRGTSHD